MKRFFFILFLLPSFLFSQTKNLDVVTNPVNQQEKKPEDTKKPTDVVVNPATKQEKSITAPTLKSLNDYLNVMNPRVNQWKDSKEKTEKAPEISNAQILEETKLIVDAQKSLSDQDLATFYQTVGDYFFDHNKVWLNVEFMVGDYLKSKNTNDLKKYIVTNYSTISSNYDIYLSNVINKEHQLVAENLEKYRSPLMKIYMLAEAYSYKNSGEMFHLLNLYHAYVLYFYRSRGASLSYDYLEGMKDRDIISSFLGSKEFDGFSTLSKMEHLAEQKSMIYRFSMSDLRKGGMFFPNLTYKNDASVKKNFSNFARSESFLSQGKGGTKKINRLLYVYFGSDYNRMFNFIKEYNSGITMSNLKEENFIDLSNKINLSPHSIEFLSNEKKSEQ